MPFFAVKATILRDVSPEVIEKCSRITGLEVTANQPDDADIQIVLHTFVPTDRVKMIQTVSAGVDHLEFGKLKDGVILCSNAGAFSDPVAEHAFAMILAHVKKIFQFTEETRNGVYRKDRVRTLSGMSLGILGHGGIGRSAARIAKALGMTVNAYTRTVKEDSNVDRFIDSPEELVKNCEVLFLALPLTKKTNGMVNRPLLSMFKGSIIVNMARSDIVDEKDMLDFLKEHEDVWYLTDVWWNEPDVAFPIPPNAMLTPHVGGISRESAEGAFIRACTNVRRYLDGKPENVVDVSEYRK